MSLIERRCPRLVADVPILDPLQKQNMAYLNSSPPCQAVASAAVNACGRVEHALAAARGREQAVG